MDGDASSRAVSSHINARPKWSRRGAVSRSSVGIAVDLGGTRVPMQQTSATLRLFDPEMSKCVSRGSEPGRAANELVSCPPPPFFFFFCKDWRRWRGFRFGFRLDGRKGVLLSTLSPAISAVDLSPVAKNLCSLIVAQTGLNDGFLVSNKGLERGEIEKSGAVWACPSSRNKPQC